MKLVILFAVIFSTILCRQVKSDRDLPLLLLATHADIRLIPENNPNNTVMVTNRLTQAVACDYIYEDNLIFWMDAMDYGKGKIQYVNMSDPHHRKVDVIASGMEQPDGLACDWIGKKIYWTDAETNRIEVSELNGTSRKVLIWGHLDQPRAIAVDPVHAFLYWTDWGEPPKIERAGMDGTKRQVLVRNNIYWPNGITIDYEQGKVYWVEANYHFIHRMNLDGSNREEVINSHKIRQGLLPTISPVSPSPAHPSSNRPLPYEDNKKSEEELKVSGALQHPSAISLFGDWIYWTDWATETIHSMFKNGTGLPHVVKQHGISPMDLLVYSSERQKPGRNPCGLNNGGCSHLCLLSPDPPHYTCACPTGVHIMPDNKTCKNGPNEILLLARRADLRVISLDTDDYSDVLIPVNSVQHAVAIEFDPVDEYVYWTDDGQRGILRAHLNGSGSEAVIKDSVEQSDGMAIDWIARNMYWTDTGRDYIAVSRLNGSSQKVLIETEIEEPRAIVLDPVAGHMYWSDWGDKAKIERANLAGDDRIIMVDTDVKWPNGLALDHKRSILFWADARNDRIERIFLNGTKREVVLSHEIPHVFGLSLLGNYLYWTDWQRRRIERMKIGDRSSRQTIIDQLPDIYGVKATSMSVLPGTNPCAVNNGGCSNLCLYTPQGVKCHCPTGLELSPSMRDCIVPEAFLLLSFTNFGGIRRISLDTARGDAQIPFVSRVDASFLDFSVEDDLIYWTNTKDMTISRSFMNGSNIEIFIDVGVEILEGLAVDWIGRNVYWADSSTNRIEVAHMDRTSRRPVVWKNIDSPRCLALDPTKGFIYWSEWGSVPRIMRADMDGSNIFQVNKGKTGRVNSLTIDYKEQRLYWVDFDINTIVSSNMQGDLIIDVIKGGASKTISSLTLFGDYVYWSDSKLKFIDRANKLTGDNQHITESGSHDIDDILVYHASRQSGVTSCSRDNGGCQHLCFSLPAQDHTCACPAHYSLNRDNTTCKAPLNFLLMSQTRYFSSIIFQLPGNDESVIPNDGFRRKSRYKPSPDAVLPIRGVQDACSVDYDPIGNMLYWLDCKLGELRRARIDGSEIKVLLKNNGTNHRPVDIAVDPYSRFLYWTDSMSNSIQVMRLDGGPIGTVLSGVTRIPGGRTVELLPRQLAVDSLRGKLYFSNACHSVSSCRFRIIRAALDGADCVVFFKRNLLNVSALAIDQHSQRLYWADQNKIEWSNLDGSSRTTLVETGLNQPVGLTIFGDNVYWVDAQADGGLLESVYKMDGSNRKKIQSRIRDLRDLVGIISMNASVIERHPCSVDNGGCSHICVTKDDGTTRCSCPNHLALLDGSNFQCGEPSTCGPKKFTCKRQHQCLPMSWVCDGTEDCTDKTDELNCDSSKVCKGQFSCGILSGSSQNVALLNSFLDAKPQCVDYHLVCDGSDDCISGLDERDCARCKPGEIHCRNGNCISASAACKDCNGACSQTDHISSSDLAFFFDHRKKAAPNNGERDNVLIIVVCIVCGCLILVGIGLFLRHHKTNGNNRYPPGVVMFTPNSDGHLNLNVEFQPHSDSSQARAAYAGDRKKPSYVNLSIVPPANGAAPRVASSRSGWPAYQDGQLAERPDIPGASSNASFKRLPPSSYGSPSERCERDYYCLSDSPSVRTSSCYRCKYDHKHRRHLKPQSVHGPPPPTPCTTDTCEDFEGRVCRPNHTEGVPPDPPPPYYRHRSCCGHCYHQHHDYRPTSSSGSAPSCHCGESCGEPPSYDRNRGRRRHYHQQLSGLNSDSDPYAPPPTPRSQYLSDNYDTTEIEDAHEVEEITNRINALSKEDDEETVLLAPSHRTSPSTTERSYSTLLYNPPPSPVTDSS